ncbi:MAG: hypothetical protein ABL921_17405 [Pirellula sp.]
MGTNKCTYECQDGSFSLVNDDSNPGFFCPNSLSSCTVTGEQKTITALPDPPEALKMGKNSGQYVYHADSKKLLFSCGECGKGKHFHPELTVKELAKIDPDTAELVKSLQKNKKVATFSVILKAQNIG